MCKYCEEDKILLSKDFISPSSWGWGIDDCLINLKKAENDMDNWGIFIDRGYLRLARTDDCQCIDSGEKIKINFCPVCGEKILDNI